MHEEQKNTKILIVEPNEEKLSSIASSFQETHFHYKMEKNFKIAGETLLKEEYDLVVIGDKFQDFSAIDVYTFLKMCSPKKEVSFILHTASKEFSFIKNLISSGISAILAYPTTPQKLVKTLDMCKNSAKSEELLDLISNLPFFKEFSQNELKILLSVTSLHRFDAGEEIITKGDLADSFYVLLKGKVMAIIVKQDNTIIDIPIQEGSPFGEMAILDNSPRSAWCVAADESLILEIGRHIINDVTCDIRMKLFARLTLIMADRIRKMNEVLNKKVKEKTERSPKESPEKIPLKKEYSNFSPEKPEEKKSMQTQTEEELPKIPDAVFSEKAEEKTMEPLPTETVKEEKKSNHDESKNEMQNLEENPYTTPRGIAENYHERINTQEEYDILMRKINLRSDFIFSKIPDTISDMVCNKMFGYWTGGKLAKVNPHFVWSVDAFTPGSHQLKKALHLVAVCAQGCSAYKEAYLNLPLSQRVVGLSEIGCAGTFLGSNESIERYLNDKCLKTAIKLDMEIPIDRSWRGKDVIEFLTHTIEDVRDDTLFLIFDDKKGKNTKRFREKFPRHQIVTVVKEIGFNFDEPSAMFTSTEQRLLEEGLLVAKNEYKGEGFYQGQTVFLADCSTFYSQISNMKRSGYIFGIIGIFANIGPDYSGIVWGSKGGADGAVKAARAMFGIKGAQSSADVAAAVNWADGS